MDALAPIAARGAPTLTDLKRDFGPAAREALAAVGQQKATGFFEKLFARMGNMISVRPAEPRGGDSVRAVISRAENSLFEEDVNAALQNLQALPASAQNAFGDWSARAQDLATARAALADIHAFVVADKPVTQ